MAINQPSTATNLSGPNVNPRDNINNYFNNLYSNDQSIGAANDAIVAFFEQYTGNKIAGQNLAAAVIYTAQAQQMDPMKVMSDFASLPKGQLNTYLVAFLNVNRVPTSLIGINNGTKTSPYIQRSILV
jgi:hypothetical protein